MRKLKSARLRWWRHAGVTALVLGCVPSAPPAVSRPAPPPAVEPWTRLTAQFRLAAVERPQNAAQRYGPQTLTLSDSLGRSSWHFEDQLVRVVWAVYGGRLGFTLRNKSDHSIRIVWEQAALVGVDGKSSPVMHIGTRYSECRGAKTASVVVRGATLSDVVIGCDNVRYDAIDREWVVDDHIEPFEINASRADSTERALRVANASKRMVVLLPLQIEEVVNEYLFTFQFSGLTRTPCTPRVVRGTPLGCR
jgi:hypothetical protein